MCFITNILGRPKMEPKRRSELVEMVKGNQTSINRLIQASVFQNNPFRVIGSC